MMQHPFLAREMTSSGRRDRGRDFFAAAASRAEVDGKADPSKIDEYEMMYGRSFEDPDGHLWGINWIDPP
jgi:predicted lactoylglutathione lyase